MVYKMLCIKNGVGRAPTPPETVNRLTPRKSQTPIPRRNRHCQRTYTVAPVIMTRRVRAPQRLRIVFGGLSRYAIVLAAGVGRPMVAPTVPNVNHLNCNAAFRRRPVDNCPAPE